MIISASRRTDIPAFYADWFYNRLGEGYCTVFNPFNRNQVRYVSLKPEDVDVIVFWTRNTRPFIDRLSVLDDIGIHYYFQYTLVDYNKSIETRVPDREKLLYEFLRLSDKIGPERVIWRYDPIIISEEYTPAIHIESFNRLARQLDGKTHRVVISIVDYYKKTLRNMSAISKQNKLDEHPELQSSFGDFINKISQVSHSYGLEIESCSEPINLKPYGVAPGKCIDDKYIQKIFNLNVERKKDPGQRKECGCVKSIDIGVYDTCLHGCQYCYATKNHEVAKRNYDVHDSNSPSMLGWYDADPPADNPQLKFF